MLKAFVNPQKECEASFDEEKALLFRPVGFFFLNFSVIFVANFFHFGRDASACFSKSN